MKKIILLALFFSACNFNVPTQFTTEVLQETLLNLSDEKTSFAFVLEKYKGKKIVIDVWASWCIDCIKNLPKVKAIQEKNTEVIFLFISQDSNNTQWKRAIKKYSITGEHYFLTSGKNGVFNDFLNSNWIPRYMVVNEKGGISLFKATKISDNRIEEALKK